MIVFVINSVLLIIARLSVLFSIVLPAPMSMAEQWQWPASLVQDVPLSPPAQAGLDGDFDQGWRMCEARMRNMSHEESYKNGKFAATILNAFYLDESRKQKDWPASLRHRFLKTILQTKSSFATAAVAQMSVYGASEKLLGCYLVLLRPLTEQPWSSVHSGLLDYLHPELKKHFFSVPER